VHILSSSENEYKFCYFCINLYTTSYHLDLCGQGTSIDVL